MVSASLESGGTAGSELIIKTTITNTATESATYTFNIAGHASWATLSGVEPNTLTLNAGESKEVLVKFNVNSDVSGDQSFQIEVLEGTELVARQPVSVPIESGFSGFSLGSNWYLWLIAALNVILVVIIIVIAVKVAKN